MTFSVVFAYVADITQEHERSMAYGLVCTIITNIHVKYTVGMNGNKICSVIYCLLCQTAFTDTMLIQKNFLVSQLYRNLLVFN